MGVGGLVGIQLRVHLLIDVSAEIYLETALRRPSRNHSFVCHGDTRVGFEGMSRGSVFALLYWSQLIGLYSLPASYSLAADLWQAVTSNQSLTILQRT